MHTYFDEILEQFKNVNRNLKILRKFLISKKIFQNIINCTKFFKCCEMSILFSISFPEVKKIFVTISNEFYKTTIIGSGLWIEGDCESFGNFENT